MTPPRLRSKGARARALSDLRAKGFAVIEAAIAGEELDKVRVELTAALERTPLGRNEFEGRQTKRVYALIESCPATAGLAEHADVLSVADEFLLRNYLLSAHLAIELQPGETAQPLHYDDGFYALPRPRRPLGVSIIWAIDEFTKDNGATEVVPGSHELATEPADAAGAVSVELAPGSALVMLGTTWHRGGSNRTDRPRLAVTSQYCEPWARQQEAMMLAVSPARARSLSPRLRQLVGYSIHPPFMGHVAGMHPERLLELGARDDAGNARDTAETFWQAPPSEAWTRASAPS